MPRNSPPLPVCRDTRADNEFEKKVYLGNAYHIGVHMNDGKQQLLTLNTAPSIAVGDHVTVVDAEPL
jgi:hypothetical protein